MREVGEMESGCDVRLREARPGDSGCRRLRALSLGALGVAIGALLEPAPLLAGPEGGQVVAGAATIQPITPTLTNVVQTSDRAVIDWESFSIAAGERVNFDQPGALSATLNRVVGADLSVIAGQLSANGQLFFVNPAGIVLSGTAQVDTQSFVATTANIGNASFMAGDLVFDGFDEQRSGDSTIRVEANAQILARGGPTAAEAGLVALVAPGVESGGVIQANLGQVILGGARTFTLDLNGDGLYSFAIQDGVAAPLTGSGASAAAVSLTGTGEVIAEGGQVLLAASTASDFLGHAVNVEGRVFARAATVNAAGEIVLSGSCAPAGPCGGDVRVAGSALLDVLGDDAGERGGTIAVSGRNVSLGAGSVLNAAGAEAGGSIALRGHGASSAVSVGGSLIADGQAGAGGSVSIASEGALDIEADLVARGANGTVTGEAGTSIGWSGSIDAEQLELAAGGDIEISTGSDGVDADTLSDALRRGATTTVTTAGALRIGGDVNAIHESATSTAALTLNAAAVAIDSDVRVVTHAGSLRIDTTGAIVAEATSVIGSSTGEVALTAGGEVRVGTLTTTGALTVESTGGDVVIAAQVGSTPSRVIVAANGGIEIDPALVDADTTPRERLGIRTASSPEGVVALTAGGEIRLAGQIDAGGAITLDANTIVLQQSLFTAGADIRLTAPGGITLDPQGPATPTFVRERVVDALDSNGNYAVASNFDCALTPSSCVLTTGPDGDPVPVFQDIAVQSRGLTLSTGGGAATGDIILAGPVDVPVALRDWGDPDDPNLDPDIVWFADGGNVGQPLYEGSTSGPDPLLYYVSLTLDAGVGDIAFQGGLATGRASAPDINVGGQGTNSLDLVVLSGNWDGTTPAVVVDSFCTSPTACATVADPAGAAVPANVIVDGHEIVSVWGDTADPPLDAQEGDPLDCFASSLCFGPPIFPVPMPTAINLAGAATNVMISSALPNSVVLPGAASPGGVGSLPPIAETSVDTPASVDETTRLAEAGTASPGAGVTVGGRGVGKTADVGRTPASAGQSADVFGQSHHVTSADECLSFDAEGTCVQYSESNEYISQDIFDRLQEL